LIWGITDEDIYDKKGAKGKGVYTRGRYEAKRDGRRGPEVIYIYIYQHYGKKGPCTHTRRQTRRAKSTFQPARLPKDSSSRTLS
jgi:hypothetical protein